MSTVKVNTINDASGGSNAVLYGVAAPANSMGFRNRIINGDMRIDQRNAGASVTPAASTYTLDRWRLGASVASKVSVQRSSVAPAGFTNSTLITSLSAYTITGTEEINYGQRIEGFNVADLGWGTATAQAVTLSFWVRSSVTGLFSGAIKNFDNTRAYVFSYTVNAANTWEQKSITIAGDTTGTWKTDNDIGILAQFCIASAASLNTAGVWYGTNTVGVTGTTQLVATNGATFYITGVQLEAGSVASPFERRDYGRELIMCQRYLPVLQGFNFSYPCAGLAQSATVANVNYVFKTTPRVPPSGIAVVGVAGFGATTQASSGTASSIVFVNAGLDACNIYLTTNAAFTTGLPLYMTSSSNTSSVQFTGCEL